jgi:hypothetical protein
MMSAASSGRLKPPSAVAAESPGVVVIGSKIGS